MRIMLWYDGVFSYFVYVLICHFMVVVLCYSMLFYVIVMLDLMFVFVYLCTYILLRVCT